MLKVNQLSGFGARGTANTLSFFNSATQIRTNTAATITAPASIQAGDLIIHHDVVMGINGASVPYDSVTPTGFTLIGTLLFVNVQTVRHTLTYKIAAGTEGGTAITGMPGFTTEKTAYKVILVFRGTSPISAVNVQDYAEQATSSTPTTQTVNASGATVPLIVLGTYADAVADLGVVNTRGMSPAKDGEVSAATPSYIAYKIYNSLPANVDVSMSDEGNQNVLTSCYLECTV